VVERHSFKGPVRWWWTAENVYDLCPYPLVDWLTMSRDAGLRQGPEWCHNRYTNVDGGQRLLVLADSTQMRSICDGMTFADGVRWVEVPPMQMAQKS